MYKVSIKYKYEIYKRKKTLEYKYQCITAIKNPNIFSVDQTPETSNGEGEEIKAKAADAEG